jgi:hypothetical protein
MHRARLRGFILDPDRSLPHLPITVPFNGIPEAEEQDQNKPLAWGGEGQELHLTGRDLINRRKQLDPLFVRMQGESPQGGLSPLILSQAPEQKVGRPQESQRLQESYTLITVSNLHSLSHFIQLIILLLLLEVEK